MRHWSQLGIRNWRARPGRTAGALAAIALGVGVVVWVTCAYESVRLALADQVWFWIGRSHLTIESPYGLYGAIPESIADEVRKDPNVANVTVRLKHGMMLVPLGAATQPTRPASTEPVPRKTRRVEGYSVEQHVFAWDYPEAGESAGGARPVTAVGIDPRTEAVFRSSEQQNITGRLLQPGDTDAALIDRELAESLGLKLGDRFVLQNVATGTDAPERQKRAVFHIVGLLDIRRVAKKQKPVVVTMLSPLQVLTGKDALPRRVTRIDVILNNPSPAALQATQRGIQAMLRARYPSEPSNVSSAEGKLRQMEAAENQTKFMLTLISTVALLTAFFVILSTLSIGMVERIGQLGMLRCLGMTRMQIAALVLAEAVPLGIVGVLLGVPVGFGFMLLTMWKVPEYVGHFAVSRNGLLLALIGGGVTTLLGAIFPMVQALRVSPLSALRSQARRPSILFAAAAAVLGAVMILAHSIMIIKMPVAYWFYYWWTSVLGVALLYIGYALLAPILVIAFSALAVRAVAIALGLRHKLLADQVGRAAWRSAGICSGLMVGLSLVVSIFVFSESLSQGWDFPKKFSEAFIYVDPPVKKSVAERVRKLPGLGKTALANERLQCSISGRPLFDFGFTRFVAVDPKDAFAIATFEFVKGDKDDAVKKLEQGGHVLVTPEFVRTQKVDIDGTVYLRTGESRVFARSMSLKVAGVITSPALDIAANYFNAGEALTMASAFVVVGTFDDLRKTLGYPSGADVEVTMFLVNFDLPAGPDVAGPPPEFAKDSPPRLEDVTQTAEVFASWRPAMPERAAEINAIEAQLRTARKRGTPLTWSEANMVRLFRDTLEKDVAPDWKTLDTADRRWRDFREELTMRLVASYADTQPEYHGSVGALKARIDRELRRATILFTTIPLVALVVAALGVGNLMMANVISRTRQLAMLRAVGATREQILRLIIGEALVLGILGCLMGLFLGLHLANSMNTMVEGIWGYIPKWTIPTALVTAAIAFTLGVCLIAGLIPALRASRSNVIDALQAT